MLAAIKRSGSKLIGKATLNVLEPGGDHEITAVA